MSDMNFAHSAQSVANSNETTIRTTEISVTLGYMLDALRDIANTLRQPKEAPATPPVLTGPSPVIVDVGCEIEYLFERPSKTTLLFRVPCDFSVAEKVFGDFAGSRGVSLEEAIKILKEAVASNNQ